MKKLNPLILNALYDKKIEGDVIKRGAIDKNAKGQDYIHNSSGE